MWDNTEVLSDGAWIAETLRKGTLLMVCDGSYPTNLDQNRETATRGIQFTDIYIYTWGYLTTTPQVQNEYISELTGLYTISALFKYMPQLYF